MEVINIEATFTNIAYSQYREGEIYHSDVPVSRLYVHSVTHQVRLYTSVDIHDGMVSVNGAEPVKMQRRGRFGRLYIGEVENKEE